MGFDSFGLPAENAAIQHKMNPFHWTQTNIEQMKSQFHKMNYHFNWRENTSDPSYYKWTQWLFTQLYKSGLAYQSISKVNWDPVDCTVLADEQVDEHGRSWRSGAQVQKRFHKQWLIKTNAFAHDLYTSENILDTGHWSFILATQRWWIKKPDGYLFYLKLKDNSNIVQVFTKYPELFLSPKAFIGIDKNHWLANGKQPNELVSSIENPFLEGNQIEIRVVDKVDAACQASVFVYREFFEDETSRKNVLDIAKQQLIGGYSTSSTYRDWLISRQRFWGTPIPMVHCPSCGTVPVSDESLPVQLPNIDYSKISSFRSQDVSSPLAKFAPQNWYVTLTTI